MSRGGEKKPRIGLPIVVEGRYDKITLLSYVEATVLTTEGFGVFRSGEKQALLRRLCADGCIVMTDSDGGGRQIRAFLSGILPSDRLYSVFIPARPGKERRKRAPSKAGTLGVEGMDRETVLHLLSPFFTEQPPTQRGAPVTKTELYLDGLSGTENAGERRRVLCRALDLPEDMTAPALLGAINLLLDRNGYRALVDKLFGTGGGDENF